MYNSLKDLLIKFGYEDTYTLMSNSEKHSSFIDQFNDENMKKALFNNSDECGKVLSM